MLVKSNRALSELVKKISLQEILSQNSIFLSIVLCFFCILFVFFLCLFVSSRSVQLVLAGVTENFSGWELSSWT